MATILAGCTDPPDADMYRDSFPAFGTTVRLEIANAGPKAAADAAQALRGFFAAVDRDWYAWGDAELSRVNAALRDGGYVDLSDEFRPLVVRAIELHALSGGLFDPAVGSLVQLWGFDSSAHLAATMAPPTEGAIGDALTQSASTADLRLTGNRLRSAGPVQLDFGGLAKGVALDRCRELLSTMGIRNALVDIGGSSLLALGRRGDRGWRIGLRNPRAAPAIGAIELADGETVSTSGDYERYFDTPEGRMHHILDPRTGRPVAGAAGVTVIVRDGALGDAASTALMVAGPDHFSDVAAAMGIDTALMMTTAGELLMTPAMRTRLLHAGSSGFQSRGNL